MRTTDGHEIGTPLELLDVLFSTASDMQAEALEGLCIDAGLLVKCPKCGWISPAEDIGLPCESCSRPVSAP